MFSRILITLIAVATTLPVFAEQRPSDQVEITLRAEARVRGRAFTLGELGVVSTPDEALKSALEATRLGKSPRIGHVMVIKRESLDSAIARLRPGGQVAWRGAERVRVKTDGKALPGPQYVNQASELLERWLEVGDYAGYELRPQGIYRDLVVPGGATEVIPRLKPEATPESRMCVWVDVFIDGTLYQSVPVWFVVKAFRPVFVARQSLGEADRVDPDALRLEHRDVASMRSRPVSADDIAGKRWTRVVEAGRPITSDMLEEYPAVEKGAEILVAASSGPVRLTVRAIALQSGRVGDQIRVKRKAGAGVMTVRVLGPRNATIDGV